MPQREGANYNLIYYTEAFCIDYILAGLETNEEQIVFCGYLFTEKESQQILKYTEEELINLFI